MRFTGRLCLEYDAPVVVSEPPTRSVRRWALVVTSAALAMTFIDETGVGVALATMRRTLHAYGSEAHWFVNGYMLVLAAFVAAGGRSSDLFGHRRVFLAGLAGFAAGSALSSAAPDAGFLIGARMVQGAGAAMMVPTALGAAHRRLRARGARSRHRDLHRRRGSVSYVFGPIAAGALTQFISWRALFWVNLPIVVVIAIIATTRLPDVRPTTTALKFDWFGLLGLAGSLGALVTGVMVAPSWGWDSAGTLGLLVAGLLILVVFVLAERAIQQPLFDLALFADRRFSAAIAIGFLVYFVYLGIVVLVPLFLQHEVHLGPPPPAGVGVAESPIS